MKTKAVPLYVHLEKDVIVSLIHLLNTLTQIGLSKSLIHFIGDCFKTSYPSPCYYMHIHVQVCVSHAGSRVCVHTLDSRSSNHARSSNPL